MTCPNVGKLVAARRKTIQHPHRCHLSEGDGVGRGCAVACDRLGRIAAADNTIAPFVPPFIFRGAARVCGADRRTPTFLVLSVRVRIYSARRLGEGLGSDATDSL